MSFRLLLVLALFVLDAWALERLWRPGMPRRGRLRWSTAIIAVPVVGALLAWRRMRPLPAPAVQSAPAPVPAPAPPSATDPADNAGIA